MQAEEISRAFDAKVRSLEGLDLRYLWDPVFERIVRQDLATGQHRNPTGKLEYFRDGFFHRPDEPAAEVREAGFAVVLSRPPCVRARERRTAGMVRFWMTREADGRYPRALGG